MAYKKWIVKQSDKELAKSLAIDCDIDPITALIAAERGYDDPALLEQFISDEVMISPAYDLIDIDLAVDCIKEAIANNEKIAVYGDYDCDGISATALLYGFLKDIGADCIYYIPDRFSEGYGMNKDAVESLKKHGVKLIITVDNGISSIEVIDYANSLGIKTVVTDHHIPKDILPNAAAVVDPHRLDCPSDFKEICGTAVAFKLVCAICEMEPEELINKFADLLAIATISDVMPLTEENRCYVKCGINQIRYKARTGISAIINVAGIEKAGIDSAKIAFGIVPRINASGRMGDASRAVEMLLCENMLEAIKIANELDTDNALRQQTEKEILTEAIEIVETNGYKNDRVIVVSGNNWHKGVVGIVASRIADKYGKSCFVISTDGENSSGSGRSCGGFPLFDAVLFCTEILTKYGGHSLAAGVSMNTSDIDLFRKQINEFAKKLPYYPPTVEIDLKLNPAALSVDIVDALSVLEPYGNGNNLPVFGIFDSTIVKTTALSGGKHTRLLLSKGDTTFTAMVFGAGPEQLPFDAGDNVDLAVTLGANYYKDEYTLSVVVKAIRPSGIDDDSFFNSYITFNDFLVNNEINSDSIAPTRADIGEVYKYVKLNAGAEEKIVYKFAKSLGPGKTLAAIKILSELKLIIKENGVLRINEIINKQDLSNSDFYKKITKSI